MPFDIRCTRCHFVCGNVNMVMTVSYNCECLRQTMQTYIHMYILQGVQK